MGGRTQDLVQTATAVFIGFATSYDHDTNRQGQGLKGLRESALLCAQGPPYLQTGPRPCQHHPTMRQARMLSIRLKRHSAPPSSPSHVSRRISIKWIVARVDFGQERP